MSNRSGRITLPAEEGMEKDVPFFARRWGIDAIRDSDGTTLSEGILSMGYDVYSTLCLIREDLSYARAHPEELQMMYLLSRPVTAAADQAVIDPLEGYFRQQFSLDQAHDPGRWWEVYDRTSGEVIRPELWRFDPASGTVTIRNCRRWHRYTVSFLARQIWEPVSMYNHLTNSWSEEHRMPLDPRHHGARIRLLETLDAWLAGHPRTNVVRFTTFFYNFDLIYDETGKERRVDWFGYLSCVSPEAMTEFEKEMGYGLRPEDFIDQGCYNSPFRVPAKRYRDWMEFQQRFVADFAAQCVRRVHDTGRKAIMFLGDHWIGTEPYGRFFPRIGLDGVVGSVGDGVTLRMIADIPTPMHEGRFLPYFFPDVFRDGADPRAEFIKVWTMARRALLHCSLDRMGFGGYLRLVRKFPDFVAEVENACNEFRELWERRGGECSRKAPFKVAFLNAWGRVRAWQAYQVTHSSFHQRTYSYLGILEAISGMDFDVDFLSFEDILETGIPAEVGVIINAGEALSSWSGGEHWKEPRLQEAIRAWIAAGGGFLGVGDPTAFENQGGFFQLEDVLGVQKETGFTLGHRKPETLPCPEHFITEGKGGIDFGEGTTGIYISTPETTVLAMNGKSVGLSVHPFGRGRAAYLAGLPYCPRNARLLRRCLFWTAGKENASTPWSSDSMYVECAFYPRRGSGIAINSSVDVQTVRLFDDSGKTLEMTLEPRGRRWFETGEFALS